MRGSLLKTRIDLTNFVTIPLPESDLAAIAKEKASPSVSERALLILYHRDGMQILSLREGVSLIIGRKPPSDCVIEDSSLSRTHAKLELKIGQVWVCDLQSTNGTWVDGTRIDECLITPGMKITFGGLPASLHTPAHAQWSSNAFGSHEQLLADLGAEVCRSRDHGHPISLVLVKNGKEAAELLGRWFPHFQCLLRPYDRTALYSRDTVEILLPEIDREKAVAFAKRIVEISPFLMCGVGCCPEHADSADKLLEVTRQALQQASSGKGMRIVIAASPLQPPEPAAQKRRPPVVVSPRMKELYRQLPRVAKSVIPVLITGETGTGKEIIARSIHESGKRANRPLICVNCGSIPQQLVVSTLFGHEKGAFTGAMQKSAGIFGAADGGTILLDEVGELPPPAQVALLRVLEGKGFQRVGSTKEVEVDVRILAATNRDLNAMCQAQTFRSDLFFRLNVLTVHLPPLRERREEIEPMCWHFIQQAVQDGDCAVSRIHPLAIELLLSYPWPGNVRELRNVIERAVVISRDGEITVEDLPAPIRSRSPTEPTTDPFLEVTDRDLPTCAESKSLKSELRQKEALIILEMLNRHNWNRKQAADALGMQLRTLSNRINAYNLKK